jgi:hypothetical protein
MGSLPTSFLLPYNPTFQKAMCSDWCLLCAGLWLALNPEDGCGMFATVKTLDQGTNVCGNCSCLTNCYGLAKQQQ